jgi:hypothetical protein
MFALKWRSEAQFIEGGAAMRYRQLMYEVVLATLVTSGWLFGQAGGSLVGTVRDSSGGVVPAAKVVATHNETGIPYEMSTNSSGDYVFPILPVGTYTLTFNLKSFEEVRVEKIEIHVAATIRQDATLSPAAVATAVKVIASTPMVQAETAEIGQLVDSSQITELPLDGRDPYQLLQLTAGSETGPAYTAGYGGSLFRPSVAGGRGGYTVFTVNGQDVMTQNVASAGIEPNVDALQEFRAITELAPASESSSSSVNVVTKSGTNRFHGAAYDFFRNNALDAHSFFTYNITATQYTPVKNQLRYNQFGGSLGGPIKKDKTFFFASVQLLRDRTQSQTTTTVPTEQMLSGDLSGIDPLTRQNFAPVYDPSYWPNSVQFPGNMVPPNRWGPLATKLLPIGVPQANCLSCLNAGLGFDYVATVPGFTSANEYLGRIDHRFSGKDALFGNFQVSPTTSFSTPLPLPAQGYDSLGTSVSVNVNENHIFSPVLLNEFRAGYVAVLGNSRQEKAPGGPNAFSFNNTPFAQPNVYPEVDVAGYPAFGNSLVSSHNATGEELYDYADNLTYIHGKHEIKMGAELIRDHWKWYSSINALFVYVDGLPPILGFSEVGFADFLLGYPLEGLTYQGTGSTPMEERYIPAAYVQDAWKIHPRLTLNFGMRYEFPQAYHDQNTTLNRMGTFDASPASQALGGRFLLAGSPNYYLPGTGVITGTGAPLIRSDLMDPDYKDFAPRFGFAYRPFNNNNTAIRGGFGLYFALQDANSVGYEKISPPFQYVGVFVNVPPYVPLGQPVRDADFFPAIGPGGESEDSDDPHNRQPRVYEWTFSVQHQLGNSLLFSAEYLGNHGSKLPAGIGVNIPPLPNATQLAALEAAPGTSATAAAERSTFPNIPLTFEYIENDENSWYEALNLKTQKYVGKGLTFSAVYTWSKALDMGSYEQTYLVASLPPLKGYSDYDHPQRFVASGVYNLPFGDTLLVPKSRVLKKFAAGWEVSGIATFEAGPPFSVLMGGADTSFRGSAVGVSANLIGPPVYSNIRQSQGIYLTEQNFVAPPFGQLGSLARNAFFGPGINNFDLGLMKNTTLTENTRLQFRTEMFDAFNHAQFSIANQALGESILAPPAGSTTPVVQYTPSSSFGRAGARSPRVVQFSLKLLW